MDKSKKIILNRDPNKLTGMEQQKATKEEKNRRHALGGGSPNELGVTQGQNGEQGNSADPQHHVPRGEKGKP